MGLDYHLFCYTCGDKSEEIEFSVVHKISYKSPEDATRTIRESWIPFLVKHSGHLIGMLDSKGNHTDPTKITGGYIMDMEGYEEKERD